MRNPLTTRSRFRTLALAAAAMLGVLGVSPALTAGASAQSPTTRTATANPRVSALTLAAPSRTSASFLTSLHRVFGSAIPDAAVPDPATRVRSLAKPQQARSAITASDLADEIASTTPVLNPGVLSIPVTLTSPAPAGAHVVINVCTPDCATNNAFQPVTPDLDGNYAFSGKPGTYEIVAELVATSPSPMVLAVSKTNGVIIPASGRVTSPISLTVAPTNWSGTVHLQDQVGNPLSLLPYPRGNTLIAVVACPLTLAGYYCSINPSLATAAAFPTTLARYVSPGTYSYDLPQATTDVVYNSHYGWNIYAFEVDASNRLATLTLGPGKGPDFTITVPQPSATVQVTGVPEGRQVSPAVLECSTAVVTVNSCIQADQATATATTAASIVVPGQDRYTLTSTGATYLAAGYLDQGNLVIDPTTSQAFDPSSPPALTVAYQTPTLAGTVLGATPGMPTLIAVCSEALYAAQSCDPLSSAYLANIGPDGLYALTLPAGSYEVFTISWTASDTEGFTEFYSSQPVPVTISSTPQTKDLVTGIPTGHAIGTIDQPGAVSGPAFVLACSGSPVGPVFQSDLLCGPGSSGFFEMAQRSYDLALPAGQWTLYLLPSPIDSYSTTAATAITVTDGQTVTQALSYRAPQAGLSGSLLVHKPSAMTFSAGETVLACPVSVPFAPECLGGAQAYMKYSPRAQSLSPTVGVGVFGLRAAPGTYRVGALLPQPAGTLRSSLSTVTLTTGHNAKVALEVTDRQTNFAGLVNERSPGPARAGSFSVLACPAAVTLAPGCAGGVSLATGGYFQTALRRGVYNVRPSAIQVDGTVVRGRVTQITITAAMTYRNLLVTQPNYTLSGTAALVNPPAGTTRLMSVRACPAGVAFSLTCSGGVSTSNAQGIFLGLRAGIGYANGNPYPSLWVTNTGVPSPNATAFAWQFALPPGSWHVAASSISPNTGQPQVGPVSTVVLGATPQQINLTAGL